MGASQGFAQSGSTLAFRSLGRFDFRQLLAFEFDEIDLADLGPRQVVTELDFLRNGIGDQGLLAFLQDLAAQLLRVGMGIFRHDEGFDDLHLVGVRDADGAGQADAGHAGDDILDLGGENRHAGDLEDAFHALFEMEIAVIIHEAVVAGMDPVEAVGMDADRIGGGSLVVEIADHPGRGVDAEFAILAIGDGGQSLGVNDFHQDIRQWQADGFGSGFELGIDSTDSDGLGQAIAFAQGAGRAPGLDEGVEALLEIGSQRVATTKDGLQAGKIGVFQVMVAEDPLEQGRYCSDEAGFFLDDDLGQDIGRELGHQDAAHAIGQHGVHAHAEAKAMEQGQDHDHGHALGIE